MKKSAIIALLIAATATAYGQNGNSTGLQKTNLDLSNALEISFTSSNNVDIQFNSLNDMLNGVETATHEVKVRSNKKFKVSVKQASNIFNYAGNNLVGSLLQVSNVMKVQVVNNNTGGDRPWLAWLFGWQSFSAIGTPVTLLTNCDAGDNRTFTVKYKATPGINFEAGTYTVDMVYTATQE